jgi:hypothetical protein
MDQTRWLPLAPHTMQSFTSQMTALFPAQLPYRARTDVQTNKLLKLLHSRCLYQHKSSNKERQ